eukprot:TRINITY_DN74838_c0_g1_i1.p1 TRINITY_DN74838_c0_g1~~TRINITY_DN74838_c0_g1_i1.p1  ORF type:complete len:269 (-),score=68.52 TRINITY_DN74838_c0_g1_i1:170-976(-)
MSDPKTRLNQFLQKYCKRPLGKDDLSYSVSWFGNQCQATVVLACVGSQEYAGHLCADPKAAEMSAAEQALEGNAELVREVEALPSPTAMARGQKRPAGGEPIPREENPAITAKSELNGLVMQLNKSGVPPGSILYSCHQVPGPMFQATVKVLCLPGDWAGRAWAGHPDPDRKKAEQSAAQQALNDLQAAEEIMSQVPDMSNKKIRQQMKGSKGGGGGGKGGGKDGGKGGGKGYGKGDFKGKMYNMMSQMMEAAAWWSDSSWGRSGGKR